MMQEAIRKRYYIPFGKVIKRNFILQEQIEYLTEELWES